MARMIIEFDEERMERDGIDVNNAWEQIEEIRKSSILEEDNDIIQTQKGDFCGDFGLMTLFQGQFEKKEWIMKYVKKWLMDYGDGVYDDLIEEIRDSGRKCCYE